LDAATTPSGSIFQLAVPNGVRESDYFKIFWGDDGQPADTYLMEQTGLPGCTFPGLCHIVWQRKNLGGSPVWPLMRYEIET
jgi:hypothetical protein